MRRARFAPTGKQKRYDHLFRYCREAKVFLADKQAELSRGATRDPVQVTLDRLVVEFEEAPLAGPSYASQILYNHLCHLDVPPE